MNFHRANWKALLFGLTLLACTLIPALAQDAGFGSIGGVVTDPKHAVIGGATVTVLATETGIQRQLQTTAAGEYFANFLKPGRYEVLVSASGFAKVNRKDVTVLVGQIVTIDVEMPLATTQDTVTISEAAPLVDTEQVGSSQEIGSEMLSNVPINGRRFDNVVLLTPNVVPDGASGLLSFRGVSGLYNTNLIDGANNNQAFFSEARGRAIGAPYVYSTDSIQEFQSGASSYSASFGQAAGGQINAVSRSGANAFHGDAFVYLRNPDMNALDPWSKQQAPMQATTQLQKAFLTKLIQEQYQYGGSVGGPILKDKLFFFFTYDGFRKTAPILYASTFNFNTLYNNGTVADGFLASTCPSPLTQAQCQAAVDYLDGAATGMYGYKTQGTFPREITQKIFFPKVDWQINEKHHLTGEFNWQNFDEPNGYNTASTVSNGSVTQNGKAKFQERFAIFNLTSVLTPRAVNQMLFQWSRDYETASTNTGGPAVSLSGIAGYGETSALPRGAFPDEHRNQIADTLSVSHGAHQLKFGVDMSFVHEYLANLFQGDGSYSYTGAQATVFSNWVQDVYGVNGGKHYTSFTQVNDPITHIGADDFWNPDISGFAEDRFKITPRLLLSAGLRYDVQLVPSPPKPNTSSALANLYTATLNETLSQFEPRVGFSYQGWKGGVVRAGYGMFYGLTSNSTYYTLRVENGVYQQQYNASPSTVWAPSSLNVLFTPPGPALAAPFAGAHTPVIDPNAGSASLAALSIRGLDPNFQNPRSQSFDATVEQELPGHIAVSAGYVGNYADRLPVFIDTNVARATTTKTYDIVDATGKTLKTVTVPWYTQRKTYATANILTGFSSLTSWYHSLVLTARKPMANGFEALVNYTYAHANDGGQVSGVNGTFNGTDTPIDPYNLGAEWGRSDLDIRSRFTATLIAAPTFRVTGPAKTIVNGWSLSTSVTAQSGMPVTGFMSNYPTSGLGVGDPNNPTKVSGDGGITGAELSLFNSGTGGRVPQYARNAFDAPTLNNVDLRLARTFALTEKLKLDLFAEAFNLTNSRIPVSVVSNNSSFASPLTPGSKGYAAACDASQHTNGCIYPYLPSNPTQSFGAVSATTGVLYGPRQMQFTAKILF
ncbi:MAG: carboxypeptidase regulatory-like domain-containing protein [Terracidiphilus sp.]